MWKILRSIIDGIRIVEKYGSLALVILNIFGDSSEKLEVWMKENGPKDEVE